MPSVYLIETQDDMARLMDGIAADVADYKFRDLMEQEVILVEDETRKRFANQVASTGQAWAPLAPSTIARKGHDRILLDSGKLDVSLTHKGHADAIIEVVDEPGQGGFARGTSVEWAGFHQTGTKHMPARPPVGVTENYCDGFAERAVDSLVEHLKARV